MRELFRVLRRSSAGPLLNIPRRAATAMRFVGPQVWRAAQWLVSSREDTNLTYPLTELSEKYLTHAIAKAVGRNWDEISEYISEAKSDSDLREHVLEHMKAYRSYADRRVDLGKRLGWYAVVRAVRPELVVETGVDKGLGSVVLCAALIRNGAGRYVGTDINPNAGKMLGGKYAEVGQVLYGDSVETLKGLPPEVGVFINDSDHSADYEMAEYDVVASKLVERAIVLGDNSHVTAKLEEWSRTQGRQFLFWNEQPKNHWYPGGGMGLSFKSL